MGRSTGLREQKAIRWLPGHGRHSALLSITSTSIKLVPDHEMTFIS